MRLLPPLNKCIEHLCWLENGVFGKNIAAMYAMKNVADIKDASSKASIYVKNNEGEADGSIEKFRERLQNAGTEQEKSFFLGANPHLSFGMESGKSAKQLQIVKISPLTCFILCQMRKHTILWLIDC